MCDAMSLASAGMQLAGGAMDARDARMRTDFETAQMDAMKILTDAQLSDDMAGLTRDFREQAEMNLAAMAVSGLSNGSFDAISKGNAENLRENSERLYKNARDKKNQIEIERQVREMEGESEARAAMFGGFMRAFSTISDADHTYKQTNRGQTRVQSFFRSIGA